MTDFPSSPVTETPTGLIDERLADLREANDIFRARSWDRCSAIERNQREISWLTKLRAVLTSDHAPTAQQRIAAPSNDQLSKLWNAIVENTKGDGFWIGEILLTTLEREVGFNPAALTDTSTDRGGK